MNIVPPFPQPPYDMVMPSGPQKVMTIIWIIFAAAATIYCVWLSLRQRSWIPVFVQLGAGLCMFSEPLMIHLQNCWYPAVEQTVFMKAVGQSLPIWIPFAYLFYFAPWIMMMIGAFEKGVSKRKFWLFYGLCWLGVTLYEIIGTVFGLHDFYGNIPFFLFGVIPLVYSFLNSTLIIIPSAIIFLLKDHLIGWRQLMVLPLMGGMVMGLETWLATPYFTANKTPLTPLLLKYITAIFSILVVLGTIELLAGIVAGKNGSSEKAE